jgi:hypothetical protein
MPAITIDRLDIGIYIQYARRTQLIEQVRQQYHLTEAGTIPAQALIVDLYPKMSELELLLGVGTTIAPWAYFFPPKSYSVQRRSPFAFHRLLPVFGKSFDSEKEEEEKLNQIPVSSKDEDEEKISIKNVLHKIGELNSLLRFIGGRIGQFLQG